MVISLEYHVKKKRRITVRLTEMEYTFLKALTDNTYEIPGIGNVKVRRYISDAVRFCIFFTMYALSSVSDININSMVKTRLMSDKKVK